MKLKRIRAALLTAAALLSLALPAAASGGSFSDINDHSTAVNVDVLRLMGAVSGDSDGTFRPNDAVSYTHLVSVFMAERNIDTLDAGVPVLSMHAPFETVSKLDCYMTYKGMKAIYEAV